MVEPIKPALRAALKEVHEDLDDDTINRLEQLTSERFQVDPQAEPERIARIDADREALLQERMPRHQAAIERASASQEPSASADA